MASITFDEFIQKYKGKQIDYDKVAGCQCLDLTKYYLDEVFGIKCGAWGNAHSWYDEWDKYTNKLKENFIRIPNTPDFIPQKGDIVVWSGKLSSGGWGHVAIANGEGTTTWFNSWDCNWTGNHDACTLVKHNYNYVYGVLRPKDQSMINGDIKTEGKNIMTTYYGIDVSEHNGSVDMNKVKSDGKNFVMIRSSYGNVATYPNQKDKQFESNVQKAKKAGLNFGIYHYSYATTVSAAQAEAKGFIALLDKIKPIPYFVALDIEEKDQYNLSTSNLQSVIKAFIDIVEGAGYFCTLYSYDSFLCKIPSNFRKRYAIWCANTNGIPTIDYGVHQYSFKGKVNGVNGDVDLNKTTIDYPTIIKNAGLNGYSKPEPTPKPAETELDTIGYKTGDKGYQALALKTLLKLAIDKGMVSGKLDDTTGLGGGSIKVVNELLDKWGYKQNGIAGENFINRIYKELK